MICVAASSRCKSFFRFEERCLMCFQREQLPVYGGERSHSLNIYTSDVTPSASRIVSARESNIRGHGQVLEADRSHSSAPHPSHSHSYPHPYPCTHTHTCSVMSAWIGVIGQDQVLDVAMTAASGTTNQRKGQKKTFQYHDGVIRNVL